MDECAESANKNWLVSAVGDSITEEEKPVLWVSPIPMERSII